MKRRPALTKIIVVLLEAFIRALETLRYTVIGVRNNRLWENVMVASIGSIGEGSGREEERIF